MLENSNDWIIGLDKLNLFVNGSPINGDITRYVNYYDAGTEKDEYFGAGNNQGPRQITPNSGEVESKPIAIGTSTMIPSVSQMLKVSITAQ